MEYQNIEFPTLDEFLDTEWYKSRPEVIKEAIKKCPPTQYYKIKNTGHQCFLYSYSEPESNKLEDVTITVIKTGRGGTLDKMGLSVLNQNGVFGLKLDDIEIWDTQEIRN